MNITIIYAHPYEKSFNAAVLKTVKKELSKKHEVKIIDLYKDNFNPVLNEEEFKKYQEGKSLDPLVENYQDILKKSDYLFFIFPIWWMIMPAMLKGFFDKVLLKYFAFTFSGKMPKGLLTHIKGATILNTMGSPPLYYNFFINKPIKGSVIKGTLKFCGIKDVKWKNLGNIYTITDNKREKWLKKIQNYCRKL